jgi:D-glycero-D-manno-heptose 1,7-bisphosphate phosphatase
MRINIFLDRDGTLIDDTGYISSPNDVRILQGVIKGLKIFKENNYRLHVVSNQSGLARGKFTEAEFFQVDKQFKSAFLENGITFDSIQYCFHLPSENCTCRKPKTGLLEQVAKDEEFNKDLSAMIGNSKSDRETAVAFGIPYWDVNSLSTQQSNGSQFNFPATQVLAYFNEVLNELG